MGISFSFIMSNVLQKLALSIHSLFEFFFFGTSLFEIVRYILIIWCIWFGWFVC